MWTLIHSLQIFRYILLVNMKMPRMIDIMQKYLRVAIGEVDEIDNLIPDWISMYIINSEDVDSNNTLYPRFEEQGKLFKYYLLGYDTPFIALLFSDQITLIFLAFVCTMPFIYLGMKVCKKSFKITRKLKDLWLEFWWNAPLRTFTELYIEISFGFFLNSLNVRN